MKIRFIVEVLSTKRDTNGNTYHSATVTSTRTGRKLHLRDVNYNGAATADVIKNTGCKREEIHEVFITDLPKRVYNQCDAVALGVWAHTVAITHFMKLE